MPRPAPIQKIDLALQGGGSHGAYTWGVLDRLLEEEDLEFSGLSGTSAGAMNAVALAAGLMEGGRDGAREALRRLWEAVARMRPWLDATRPDPTALPAPWAGWMEDWMGWMTAPGRWWGDALGRTFSPYQLNPLNLNPLRQLLSQTIDFERVRCCSKTRLFIAATDVHSGRLRLFRQQELTVESVLASTCLPLLFQAVEIDGSPYWDGGYAGNPSLMPLIAHSEADDLLLVQINPTLRTSTPRRATEIIDRMNEITFNTSLLKELRSLALMQQMMQAEAQARGTARSLWRSPLLQRMAALRVHRIDGTDALAGFGAHTKLDTAPSFIERLHGLGRRAAQDWLDAHRADLGQRSSLDLAAEFGDQDLA